MKYNLFLFDLDDTLLDFKKSEHRAFSLSLQSFGITSPLDDIFKVYQKENQQLWRLFEASKISQDFLKVERFRKTFELLKIDINPEIASHRYLETLPETVVMIDYAFEICQWLSQHGELGIITNGIRSVQYQRIQNSPIAPYLSFISVSEDCGFAKPDVRFFEFSVKMAKKFSKDTTLIVGDRIDADILGGQRFGIDGCWFNPDGLPMSLEKPPSYEIKHLSEIKTIL